MSLNYLEITEVLSELTPLVRDGFIQKVRQPGERSLILDIRKPGKSYLLFFSTEPRTSRLHLLYAGNSEEGEADLTGTVRSNKLPAPPPFCMLLRRHLIGSKVKDIYQVPEERIVRIEVCKQREEETHQHVLIAELMERWSNIFLLDDKQVILGAQRTLSSKGNRLRLADPYLLPPASHPPEGLVTRSFDEFAMGGEGYGYRVARSYFHFDVQQAMEHLCQKCRVSLRKEKKKRKKTLDQIERDQRQCGDPSRYKYQGDLLKAHFLQLKKGMKEISCPDIFKPEEETVTIALKPALTPAENLQWYYGQYKKLKKRQDVLALRARELGTSLERIEDLAKKTEDAVEIIELEVIRDELLRQGWIKEKVPEKLKVIPASGSQPRSFTSLEGYRILVGRNDRQNDELTFRVAKGEDLWLHVQGYPGSHVVVQTQRGKSVPRDTLLDAATLTLYFSKLRNSGRGEVLYTQRKYLKKPKGGKEGVVLTSQSKTIFIEIASNRLHRLLGST